MGARSRGRLARATQAGRVTGSVAPDRVDHGVTQFMQTAVKEVPDSGHHYELRSRFEAVHPGDHALRIDYFVGVALHDQPWTRGCRHAGKIEVHHRRSDRDEMSCPPLLYQTQGDVRAK